jgi:hypothetical protein
MYSSADWDRYSYTFYIATKVNTSTSLGMYYTAIFHNRPYPPILVKDKDYSEVGRETYTYKMHIMYPFLKPIPQSQVMTDLKNFSSSNSNTLYNIIMITFG